MNQKRPSQKRPWYRLDDSNLRCPHCKGLEEHRNGSCPRKLSKQTEDTNMDVGTGKDHDTGKRQCYRCGDCYLSFTDIQHLEGHKKKDCLGKPIINTSQLASYQSCMDVLKCTMNNKKSSFDSFMKAKSECNNAVERYSIAKKQKESALNTYREAVAREKALCTIVSHEEQLIMSDIVSRSYNKVKDASKEEQQAAMSVDQAVRKLKTSDDIATFAASEEQLAFSEVVKVLKVQSLTTSSPQSINQEIIKLRTILEQSHNALSELQKGVAELVSSISVMIGINPEEKEHGINENSYLSRDPTFNILREKLARDNVKLYQMDVTSENIDDARPSSSGTYSGNVSDVCLQPSENMN